MDLLCAVFLGKSSHELHTSYKEVWLEAGVGAHLARREEAFGGPDRVLGVRTWIGMKGPWQSAALREPVIRRPHRSPCPLHMVTAWWAAVSSSRLRASLPWPTRSRRTCQLGYAASATRQQQARFGCMRPSRAGGSAGPKRLCRQKLSEQWSLGSAHALPLTTQQRAGSCRETGGRPSRIWRTH